MGRIQGILTNLPGSHMLQLEVPVGKCSWVLVLKEKQM